MSASLVVTVPTIVEFVTDAELLGSALSRAQDALLRATYGTRMSMMRVVYLAACALPRTTRLRSRRFPVDRP